jgi:hypothetical protein
MEVSRSQWPRGLRCRSAAARLLRLRIRIPTGAWMFVVSVNVLLGRGLCVQRSPTESVALLCVRSRNLVNEEAIARCGLLRQKNKRRIYYQSDYNLYNTTHSVVICYMFRPLWRSPGSFYNKHGKEYRDTDWQALLNDDAKINRNVIYRRLKTMHNSVYLLNVSLILKIFKGSSQENF